MLNDFEKISEEVFVAKQPIVKISMEDTAFLKKQAAASSRKRARICAHKSNQDELHQMVIAIHRQSYIQPHRHEVRSESFHVIEGEADVVVFSDEGEVTDVIGLGGPGSGKAFFYRLEPGRFHTLVLKTEYLVFHEITTGPFVPNQTAFASWSPAEGTGDEGLNYIEALREKLEKFEGAVRHEA